MLDYQRFTHVINDNIIYYTLTYNDLYNFQLQVRTKAYRIGYFNSPFSLTINGHKNYNDNFIILNINGLTMI